MESFRYDITVWRFFAFIMACFGLAKQETTDGRFIANYGLNVSVVGTVMSVVMTRTALRCVTFCHRKPTCIGVNYMKSNERSLNCDLLATSYDVIPKSGVTFYGKGVAGISTTADLTTVAITTTSASIQLELNRTVIAIQRTPTHSSQDMFVRGGNHKGEPIDIIVRSLGDDSYFDKYNAWLEGNLQLKWQDPPSSQGLYNGLAALGTPMAKTTNTSGYLGYHELNTFGSDYWLVDLMMNCSMTSNGWFELKAVVRNLTNTWEPDISQDMTCQGTAGGSRPDNVINHVGRCGFVNVFHYSQNHCEINHLP